MNGYYLHCLKSEAVYFFPEILPPITVLGKYLFLTNDLLKDLLEERKNDKEEKSKEHMGSGSHHSFFLVKHLKQVEN